MKNQEPKGIFLKSIFISLSGGLSGILFFLIISQAGDRNLSIFKINYFLLAFLMIFFSVFYTVFYMIISIFSAKLNRIDVKTELNKNFIIFCLPLSLLFILPLYFFIYEKLKMINLKMVGFVYLPFGKFVHFLFPGYFLIMIFGFYLISIAFFFMLRFIFNEYNDTINVFLKDRLKKYFLLLFLFYVITTTYITTIYPPTGDEPHYLLIAKSLIYDRDFNLENNYTDTKFYMDFYPAFLEYENIHNTKDKTGKGIYSIHSPGLPFLISLPYFLGKRIGVQIFMNFLTALFIIVLFLYLQAAGISKKIAFLTVFITALTVPFLINSSLVLTEIPAVLIITYALLILTKFNSEKDHILFFIGISFLPFIHSKLALFSVIFYLYYYFLLLKSKKLKIKNELLNNILVLITAFLFMLYYYSIYGKTATGALTSIYTSESFYFIFSIKHFIKAFLATLFDRDYGLFIYNPFCIIFIWGILLVIFKKEKEKLLQLLFILPYYILFLLWKDWGGSMTPARQLIPVLPVFIYYTAYFLERTEFIKTKIFKILISFSFFISYFLMIIPAIRYFSGKEKIYAVLQNSFFKKILYFFPSFYDNIIYNYFLVIIYFTIIILLFLKLNSKKV